MPPFYNQNWSSDYKKKMQCDIASLYAHKEEMEKTHVQSFMRYQEVQNWMLLLNIFMLLCSTKKLSKLIIWPIRFVIDLLCRTMASDDKAVWWFICLCCRECNPIYTGRGNILVFVFKISFCLKELYTVNATTMEFMMKYS